MILKKDYSDSARNLKNAKSFPTVSYLDPTLFSRTSTLLAREAMSAPPILSEFVEIKISSKLSQELSKKTIQSIQRVSKLPC